MDNLKESAKEDIYNAMENLQQIEFRATAANCEYMLAALYGLRDLYKKFDTEEGAGNVPAAE